MIVKFPVNWKPYPFQVPLWNYLVEDGGKRAVAVWHRRAGKDILGINLITAMALKEIGTYWYVYPTYNQARLSVWDGMTLEGRPYMSYIPEEYIASQSQGKARIVLTNGSIIQFVGSDRHEKLRGSGIKGAVISEYSFHDPKAMSSVIEPMLLRSDGWAVYVYTPTDKEWESHGYDLYKKAKEDKNWYCDLRTIENTTDNDGVPLVSPEKLRTNSDMSEEQIQREFYCNFAAAKYSRGGKRSGNIYHTALSIAENSGRIGYFPHDPAYPVDTYWDWGIVDFTTIWFVQERENDVVVIDFYYNRNKTPDYYLNFMRTKGSYQYRRNVLPHDFGKRDSVTLTSQLSRVNEMAEKLCFPPFYIGKKGRVDARIERSLEFLNTVLIDGTRCHRGLEALKDYQPDKRKKNLPGHHSTFEHDAADSFGYMALEVKTKKARKEEFQIFDNELPSSLMSVDDSNPLDF
jgi:phage terminase large subunit